jgi:hypothetical protein
MSFMGFFVEKVTPVGLEISVWREGRWRSEREKEEIGVEWKAR